MIEKLVLTRRDLCDMVALVLKYNKKTATQFMFRAVDDGSVLFSDFECEIDCETSGLKVRDVPEDDETKGILFAEMDKATRMFEEWRKNRPTATTTQRMEKVVG